MWYWKFQFIILALFGMLMNSAHAEGGASDKSVTVTAKVYRDKKKPPLNGLTIPSTELPLFFVPRGDNLKTYVELPITFNRPGWSLNANNKIIIDVDKQDQIYSIPIYLKPKMNALLLSAHGPNGSIETETIYIFAPETSEKAKSKLIWDSVILSAGLASINYYQAGTGTYNSMTGLISIEYATPPQYWSGLSYYLNASLASPPLWESPVKSGSQVIEAKADVGYFLATQKESSARHQFLAGLSYLTMFSNSSPFGFANLIAPDFGYRLNLMRSEDSAFIFDFRYVALAMPTQFKIYGFNLNSSYTFKFSNGHRGEAGLNYLNYRFYPEEERVVNLGMFQIKFGYSF